MAGLNWVRLDANLHSNYKVLTLLAERNGDHALNVYCFALGYSGAHGTAGFIPIAALGLFHGKPRDAAQLVAVGMWHEVPGGYEIHDWLEYQPTDEESIARSARAKKAAETRWANAQKKDAQAMLRASEQAMLKDPPSNARYERNATQLTLRVQDMGENTLVPDPPTHVDNEEMNLSEASPELRELIEERRKAS